MQTVLTNGCFDVLHAGHVDFLATARRLGDRLVVYLNSDESVMRLKGPTRPLQPWPWRERCLQELRCVDEVRELNDFDMVAVLERTPCDVWVKGGDYTIETLNQREVVAAKMRGIEIKILPVVFDTHTSDLLLRL